MSRDTMIILGVTVLSIVMFVCSVNFVVGEINKIDFHELAVEIGKEVKSISEDINK